MFDASSVIAALFKVRDVAHYLHLGADRFSQHVAFGELYEGIAELADKLAEVYIGRHEEIQKVASTEIFNEENPDEFVQEINTWADQIRDEIPPEDTEITHVWDEIITLFGRSAYKVMKLK